ncbi:MAG: hypothetical protein JOZ81_26280 [Chloroflexi bacterium]|nr:hypothetical protein [Chloroflexota bacterium]
MVELVRFLLHTADNTAVDRDGCAQVVQTAVAHVVAGAAPIEPPGARGWYSAQQQPVTVGTCGSLWAPA